MPVNRRRAGNALRNKKPVPLQPIRERLTENFSDTLYVPDDDNICKKEQSINDKGAGAKSCNKKGQEALLLLQLLETQVEERCRALRSETERRIRDIRRELRLQLMCLPETIRKLHWNELSMTISVNDREYIPLNAEDLKAEPNMLFLRQDTEATNHGMDWPSTPSHTNRMQQWQFATPASSKNGRMPGSALKTIPRTAMKNERLLTFSVNGSPILPDPETAVKSLIHSNVKRSLRRQDVRDNEKCETDSKVADTICTEEANMVDLSLNLLNPDQLRNLSDTSKSQAKAQLQALHEKMEEYKLKVQTALNQLL